MEQVKGTEVVDKVEVTAKAEELKPGKEKLAVGLETAVNDVVEQVKYCDDQVALWTQRKQDLQAKLSDTLGQLQKQFAPAVGDEKKIKLDKNATVSELIQAYLEKHGPSRTRDIRQFLLNRGKKTNPGVAIGRLTKEGSVKRNERGVYQLSK